MHFESIPLLEPDVRTREFSSFKRIAEWADFNSWLFERNGERVMFYDKGPGCVTRLWMTAVSDSNSRINFYFDGETNASFSVTPGELYGSGTYPYPVVAGPSKSAGGRICYIPFPYEKSLVITDAGSSRIPYYNITYEKYPEGEGVETWDGSADYAALSDYLSQAGTDPKPEEGNQSCLKNVSIAPGETLDLLDLTGSGVIQSLELDPSPATPELLSGCAISMEFDGQTTVDAIPLDEFFGSAVGEVEVRSLPIGMRTNGNWYCYFPMPYWESAAIRIHNGAGTAISLSTKVSINSQGYDSRDAGYFCAQRHSASYSKTDGDLVIFDADKVAGKFVGLSLYMEGDGMGDGGMMYLEGDARIYIDGSRHPFIHGTGNEDWFNAAFYYNDYSDKGANQEAELFSMPYHGLPAKYHYHGADNWTQAYRFNIADPINFASSMLFTLEHGGYPHFDSGYYAAIAYSYQRREPAGYLAAEIGAENAPDHFYGSNGVSSTNTARFITPHAEIDATNQTFHGFSGVTRSAFSASIPPGNHGVVLRSLQDFSSGTNSATVCVNGTVAGRWSQVDLSYTNSSFGWGICETVLPESLTKGKTRLDIRVDYSAPATEYGFQVLPLARKPETDALYQSWVCGFGGLGCFTNLLDDPDGDLRNNLAEYATGGNPAMPGDAVGGTLQVEEGAVEYLFRKRQDAEHRRLGYFVEYANDLPSNSWFACEEPPSGTSPSADGFEWVTQRVESAGDELFVRLRVEHQR